SAFAAAVIHIPERSGLPSLVLGAGADRLGRPSPTRGMFGVRCFTHCAHVVVDAHTDAATSNTAPARKRHSLTAPPRAPGRPAWECHRDAGSTSRDRSPS